MIAVRRRRTSTTNQGGAQIPAGGVAGTVAPASIEVTPRFLRVGDGYSATLVVTGYPAEVGPAARREPLFRIARSEADDRGLSRASREDTGPEGSAHRFHGR